MKTYDSRPSKITTDTIVQILINDYFQDGKKIFALTEGGRIYYLNVGVWQLFAESPKIEREK